jgi:capsular polysaccharide biosynthesis protein
MELKEFLYIIRTRILLILYITLILTLITAVVSYFVIKPKYKADISVIIGKTEIQNNNSETTLNEVMMYQTMVKTYSKLTKSRVVAEDVIKKLNLKSMKSTDLISMITVTPDNDTQFLTITVVSKQPEQAVSIANQFAKSLKEVSTKANKVDVVELIDEAQLPIKIDSPRPVRNMAMAVFIGFMLSIGLVFLLGHLDNTIKTKEDVEKAIGFPVIGTITLIDTKNKDVMIC